MTSPRGLGDQGLPAPPVPLDALTEELTEGEIFFRVHESVLPPGEVGGLPVDNPGNIPNPGFGKPSRFAFFGRPTVPALYIADSPEAAVHETILHDVEPGSFVPRNVWQGKVLTVLQVIKPMTVAKFHSDGLRRLGVSAAELTESDARFYPITVLWAEAAFNENADGVSYMCRHYNSSRAVCAYGQRPSEALEPVPHHPQTRVFSDPLHFDWLAGLAGRMNVTINP